MAGLFDFNYEDPQQVGQYGFAAGLLNAAGPSRMPISTGQAIAQGLVMRQQAAAEADQNRRRNELVAMQMQQQQMLLEQARRQQAEQEQARALMQQYAQTPAQQAGSLPGGPTMANAAAIPQMPGGFDANAMRMAAMRSGNLAGVQLAGELAGKAPAPLVTKPGDVLRDPSNPSRILAQNPEAAKESETERIAAMVYGRGTPAYLDYMRQVAAKLATHAPAATAISYGSPVPVGLPGGGTGYVQPPNRQGAPPQLMTTPTGEPYKRPAAEDTRPMTDTQANANLYSTRMEKADSLINDLEGKYNRTQLAARQAVGEGVVGTIASSALPATAQQADQAQRDFLNAVLRRESGAVISPTEFSNGRQQYFPQPGDSTEVVRQKAANRKTAIEGVRAAAGPKAPKIGGGEQPPDLVFNPATGKLERP